LIRALHARTESAILTGGTAALARRAGRTPQHLNATLKKWRGITCTDAVNEARMDVAARELRTSTKKIIEICFDCGLQNLAHFYKLFHRRYGMTPRLYRAKHHAVVRS
jgi:AraC family cel operon transcriptional repressor